MGNKKGRLKRKKKNRSGERLRKWRIFNNCRTYTTTRLKKIEQATTPCNEEKLERFGNTGASSTTQCIDVDLNLDVRESEDSTIMERTFFVDLKYEENKKCRRANKQTSISIQPKNKGFGVDSEIGGLSETKGSTSRSQDRLVAVPDKEKFGITCPSETKISPIESQNLSSTAVQEKEDCVSFKLVCPSEIEDDLASTEIRHRDDQLSSNRPATMDTQILKPSAKNVENKSKEDCQTSVLQHGPRTCTIHNLILKEETHDGPRSAYRFQCSLCEKVEKVCLQRIAKGKVNGETGMKEVFARVDSNYLPEQDETIESATSDSDESSSAVVQRVEQASMDRESAMESLNDKDVKTTTSGPAGADDKTENDRQPRVELLESISRCRTTGLGRVKTYIKLGDKSKMNQAFFCRVDKSAASVVNSPLTTAKVASQYDDGPEQTTSRVHTDSEADDNTLSEQGEVDQLDDEPKSDQQIFIEENQAYKTFKINQKRERENAVHDEYQRVKKSLLEASEGLEIMFQNMKKVQREEEVEEDDCAMYVRTVADRLRQLSQCARATVKSKIDNLLFEAFLQNSTDIAEDTETIEIVESNIKIECQDESYSYT